MILSVSRRTDIPAFYMPWFMNRLREGYVMVRNPMNYHQVSRVSLSPEVIDCMVFWTKNAIPLTPHLGEIALQYPVLHSIYPESIWQGSGTGAAAAGTAAVRAPAPSR